MKHSQVILLKTRQPISKDFIENDKTRGQTLAK